MIITRDCPRVVFCVRGELTSEDPESCVLLCFCLILSKTKNNTIMYSKFMVQMHRKLKNGGEKKTQQYVNI